MQHVFAPEISFLLFALGLASPGLATQQTQALADHAVSREYNRSLGVECGHCHNGSDFADASKPTFDFARRMERMVSGISDGPLRELGGVTCWSCHRGHVKPPRLPCADWESIATSHAADFAGGRRA